MMSLPGSKFEKQRQCPSSELLLSYQQQLLIPDQSSRIATHLSVCDFCAAELQLLSSYRPLLAESPESPPMPAGLRVLAEALLNRNHLRSSGSLQKIFE